MKSIFARLGLLGLLASSHAAGCAASSEESSKLESSKQTTCRAFDAWEGINSRPGTSIRCYEEASIYYCIFLSWDDRNPELSLYSSDTEQSIAESGPGVWNIVRELDVNDVATLELNAWILRPTAPGCEGDSDAPFPRSNPASWN